MPLQVWAGLVGFCCGFLRGTWLGSDVAVLLPLCCINGARERAWVFPVQNIMGSIWLTAKWPRDLARSIMGFLL